MKHGDWRRQGSILDFDASAPSVTPAVRPTARATGERVSETGIIERFVYRNTETGFGIAWFRADGGRGWTIKGALWGVNIGDPVALEGVVEEDPRHGPQVRVTSLRPHVPATRLGVERYLKTAKLDGIGERTAARILDILGDDALAQIRADPLVLNKVKGLARKAKDALVAAVHSHADAEANAVFLMGLGLGPALTSRVVQRYGDNTVRQVRDRPYALADDVTGIGFRTADRIARGLGVGPDDVERLRAGLIFALHELAQQGHTAPPESLVLEVATGVLELDVDAVQGAVDRLVASGALVREEERLSLPDLADAERRVAERLVALLRRPELALADVDARLAAAELALGFSLQGTQRAAVVQTLQAGVLVVTGGPGTGKTTIIRGVLAALAHDRPRVLLAAPTGRAARRLAEATGVEAKTLHRLLEFDPRTGKFQRSPDQPLDADLIVVDEVSMMEAPLAAALLEAVAPHARILLVGDADQLPSVGPGAVLDDIIQSGRVPVVALDRVYRQGEGSQIARNAHRVRVGDMPVTSPAGEGDFFMPRDEPDAILSGLLEIVQKRLPARGFDPMRDIQVLAPMHRGPLGTQALNEALRDALNPHGPPLAGGLRVGDKVQQLKNDYDLDIFNGDIGIVIARAEALVAKNGVRVRFGDREVDVDGSALENLQLAYAVTVHKSQGSEYPAVVLPLHLGHHVMLQRNLLYTALTRAQRFAVIVGSPRAIERAVDNDAPIHRHTGLQRQLARASGDT